jgi:hypothetical protein
VNAGDQERIREELLEIEQEAGTNGLKWHKTQASRRLKYLTLALAKQAGGCLASHTDTLASSPAEAIRFPSGAKATDKIAP